MYKINITEYKGLISLIFWVIALVSIRAYAQESAEEFSLTILHTNDLHARFEPFNRFDAPCRAIDVYRGESYGGIARMAAKISEERSRGGNILLLDAGDQFQGTLFYSFLKSLPSIRFMNAIGYDAMAVGNHEFDDGVAELANLSRGLEFPLLCANYDFSAEPLLSDLIKPRIIKEFKGKKVGLIGVLGEETVSESRLGENIIVMPIEDALIEQIHELESEGADIIVLISHAGYEKDLEIARRVSGIDIIIGGHSHFLFSNTYPEAQFPYPQVEFSPQGEPTLIVSAGYWGKYLGKLDVVFSEGGAPKEWSGDSMLIDDGIEADQSIADEVRRMAAAFSDCRAAKIGEIATEEYLQNSGCTYQECLLGNMVADAFFSETKSFGVQAAFVNGGNLRASLAPGKISFADLFETLPFQNTISIFGLKGSDLKEALENSVRKLDGAGKGSGRFLIPSEGLEYAWNPQKPQGERVVSIKIKEDGRGLIPIEADKIYRIAVSSYLRQGGDGYHIFEEKAIEPLELPYVDLSLVLNYLAREIPAAPKLEGRVKKISR